MDLSRNGTKSVTPVFSASSTISCGPSSMSSLPTRIAVPCKVIADVFFKSCVQHIPAVNYAVMKRSSPPCPRGKFQQPARYETR